MIKELLMLTALSFQQADTIKGTRKANRLIHATSPYLLQHAYNPVDWYEWGREAFEKAKSENRPILVSIGYSSCHWCHVMERESFENPEIANIMNQSLVCIKVDREERPDIDQLYMEAAQMMGLGGGWPLNVFLTPDQKPFYGGAYFPPVDWAKLILQVGITYKQRPKEIKSSAEQLTSGLQSGLLPGKNQSDENLFTVRKSELIFSKIVARLDPLDGGLKGAPKFPVPSLWNFLLQYQTYSGDRKALELTQNTLKKMALGGMFDHIGGGFARYSVDSLWHVPHFEKMLCDNAQLVGLYSDTYSLTKDEFYKDVVYETVEWLTLEMRSLEGGFYSAMDADSQGKEGEFYVWEKNEIDMLLGTEARNFSEYYSISKPGNWEGGKNILYVSQTPESFARTKKMTPVQLKEKIKKSRSLLRAKRNSRERPLTDEKVITSWNALMITSLTRAYQTFGDRKLLELALGAISFIEKNLVVDGRVYRVFNKNQRSGTEGFLEDYACLIQAYLSLYECTFDEKWLMKAASLCEYVSKNFFDPEEKLFHYASGTSEQLIARKKELFDNALPSSNGMMARNLHKMGIMLDKDEWIGMAKNMVSQLSVLLEEDPAYLASWCSALLEITDGMNEVVIIGPQAEKMRYEMSKNYLPFSILAGSVTGSELPLLAEKKPAGKKTTFYVCRNRICKLPVHSLADALAQVRQK